MRVIMLCSYMTNIQFAVCAVSVHPKLSPPANLKTNLDCSQFVVVDFVFPAQC